MREEDWLDSKWAMVSCAREQEQEQSPTLVERSRNPGQNKSSLRASGHGGTASQGGQEASGPCLTLGHPGRRLQGWPLARVAGPPTKGDSVL